MRKPTSAEALYYHGRGLNLAAFAVIAPPDLLEQVRRQYGEACEVFVPVTSKGRRGTIRDVRNDLSYEMLIEFEDGQMVWLHPPTELRHSHLDGLDYHLSVR